MSGLEGRFLCTQGAGSKKLGRGCGFPATRADKVQTVLFRRMGQIEIESLLRLYRRIVGIGTPKGGHVATIDPKKEQDIMNFDESKRGNLCKKKPNVWKRLC